MIKKLLLIIIILIISLVGFNYFKPMDIKWGELYYKYLLDLEEYKNFDDFRLSFIEYKNKKEPIMLIKYMNNNTNYLDIFYISNNKVQVINNKNTVDIKLMYDRENSSYSYYYYDFDEENEYLNLLTDVLKDKNLIENPNFTFENKLTDILTLNGSYEYRDYNKRFVEATDIEYFELNAKKLKDSLKSAIEKYEPLSSILTSKIKNDVSKKCNIYKENYEDDIKYDHDEYKELIGLWYNEEQNFFLQFSEENNKKIFQSGWYASEGDLYGEIQEIDFDGDEVIFKVKTNELVMNISRIDEKIITMNDKTYKYIATDLESAQEILLDMIN